MFFVFAVRFIYHPTLLLYHSFCPILSSVGRTSWGRTDRQDYIHVPVSLFRSPAFSVLLTVFVSSSTVFLIEPKPKKGLKKGIFRLTKRQESTHACMYVLPSSQLSHRVNFQPFTPEWDLHLKENARSSLLLFLLFLVQPKANKQKMTPALIFSSSSCMLMSGGPRSWCAYIYYARRKNAHIQ